MAIVQDFEANFTQFQSAVKDADAQLKSFATDSDKIATQLGRMTDQFSGTKVIQQATLMAEAIDRVGGASSLTTAELAKIAPTVNEAVDKLSKMGVDVPANLQAIADATKGVTTNTEGLTSELSRLIQGYVGLEGIRKAIDWVEDTAAQAHALEILSNQTGIATDELQVLQVAFEDAGVDANELSKALFTVSQKAAGGDDSVARGLHMMGMSLDDIKNLNGEDLLLKIEHGLSTLQGSLRDSAAAEIFGTKLGRALAGASTNIDETLQHVRDFNKGMDPEGVKAFAEFDKAIKQTETNLGHIVANGLTPAAQGFNILYFMVNKAGFWDTLKNAGKDLVGSFFSPATFGLQNMRKELDNIGQSMAAETQATEAATAAGKDHVVQLTAQQQAEQFVANVRKDATKALTDWQAADLEALDKIGQANEKNAAAIGVSAQQFETWKTAADQAKEEGKKFQAAVDDINTAGQGWQGTLAQMDGGVVAWSKHLLEAGASAQSVATFYKLTPAQITAITKSLKDDTDQLRLQGEQVKVVGNLWNDYFTLRTQHGATATDQQIADIHRWEQAQILAAQHAHTDTVSFYGALAAEVNEKLRSISVDWSAINNTMTTDTQAGLQQIADKAKATLDFALTQVGHFSAAAIQKFRDQADAAQKAADDWGTAYATNADKATTAINKTGQAIDDTAAKAKKAADDAKAQAAADRQAFTVNPAAAGTSDSLTAAAMVPGSMLGFGGGQMIQSVADSTTGQYEWLQRVTGRASGGAVTAGTPYLVGEQGPELFVPGSSGSITPNGGGPTINNTFHLVDTASNLARQVSDLIARQVTQARRI